MLDWSQFEILGCPGDKGPAKISASLRTALRSCCTLDEHGRLHLDETCLQKYVGQGSYGIVFEAIDSAGARIALKLFDSDLGHENATNLVTEFVAGLRCRSSHVATYFRLVIRADNRSSPGHARGIAYLIREYVPGETLSFQRLRVLPPNDRLRIYRDLARGLRDIHGAGLLHRDIKPQNAIYNEQSAKWLDLGQVRFFGEQQQHQPLPGTARETRTLPPEAWRNGLIHYDNRDWDQRGDVFSFGATLFHLETNRWPVSGTGREFEKGLESVLVNSAGPSGLTELIREMMAVRTADRPNIESVLNSLDRAARST